MTGRMIFMGKGQMDKILIEVACAFPERQTVIEIECDQGVTIENAIQQSDILSQFPELEDVEYSYGVFGLRQPSNFVLSNHDRVEIFRPLILSPTEARRLRAKSKSNK